MTTSDFSVKNHQEELPYHECAFHYGAAPEIKSQPVAATPVPGTAGYAVYDPKAPPLMLGQTHDIDLVANQYKEHPIPVETGKKGRKAKANRENPLVFYATTPARHFPSRLRQDH